ncbi:hypothetical protein FB45DRAFT_887299, partial [Roridomyces roridus]
MKTLFIAPHRDNCATCKLGKALTNATGARTAISKKRRPFVDQILKAYVVVTGKKTDFLTATELGDLAIAAYLAHNTSDPGTNSAGIRLSIIHILPKVFNTGGWWRDIESSHAAGRRYYGLRFKDTVLNQGPTQEGSVADDEQQDVEEQEEDEGSVADDEQQDLEEQEEDDLHLLNQIREQAAEILKLKAQLDHSLLTPASKSTSHFQSVGSKKETTGEGVSVKKGKGKERAHPEFGRVPKRKIQQQDEVENEEPAPNRNKTLKRKRDMDDVPDATQLPEKKKYQMSASFDYTQGAIQSTANAVPWSSTTQLHEYQLSAPPSSFNYMQRTVHSTPNAVPLWSFLPDPAAPVLLPIPNPAAYDSRWHGPPQMWTYASPFASQYVPDPD